MNACGESCRVLLRYGKVIDTQGKCSVSKLGRLCIPSAGQLEQYADSVPTSISRLRYTRSCTYVVIEIRAHVEI